MQESLAKLIDMPQEDFEREVVMQKTSVGEISSLLVFLQATYNTLTMQKEGVVQLVTTKQRRKDDPEVQKCLNGLYAEMTKIELKVLYLEKRRKELISATEQTPLDTTS